eukprot:7898818-Pyramimonas_sp.AAC.1
MASPQGADNSGPCADLAPAPGGGMEDPQDIRLLSELLEGAMPGKHEFHFQLEAISDSGIRCDQTWGAPPPAIHED